MLTFNEQHCMSLASHFFFMFTLGTHVTGSPPQQANVNWERVLDYQEKASIPVGGATRPLIIHLSQLSPFHHRS